MNFIQRRRLLKNANYLEMIPIRQIDHITPDETQLETRNSKLETNITLLVPKFRNKWLSNLLYHKSSKAFIHIHLDEFGSAVWLFIDGKSDVDEICNKLSAKFGDKVAPAHERVTKFLTKLYDNRLITYKQLLEQIQ